uniref:PABS domain-containing protein n=1 Tax=Haemonchus contortus TaxID=6289 RepID=A0A7I4XUT0_HAECO|nr:Spermine/spermidine synthase family protein [Haemonchus contortus]
MNHHSRWLFTLKNIILCAILAAVVVRFKNNLDKLTKTTESGKILSLEEFGKIFVEKYGHYRILEESVCLMDGHCVYIADSVDQYGDRFSLIREMISGSIRISHMGLKLPSELTSDNLDSSRWEIDKGATASSSYLMTMLEEAFISGALDPRQNISGTVLSIGLGAGFLNNFLHHHFPRLNITVVELDPKLLEIAQEWYDLQTDDNHRVIIADGMAFIEKAVEKGERYDLVFLDACTLHENAKFLCPVEAFTTTEARELLAKLVEPKGTIIVNTVTVEYDIKELTKELISDFDRAFNNCILKSSPKTNVIMTCSHRPRSSMTF